jgi:hypothetical protein
MAQTITGFSNAPYKEIVVPIPKARFTLADQTATTAVQDAGSAAFEGGYMCVALKAFTGGTGTVGPIFSLQCSSSATFASDVVDIGMWQPDRTNLTAGAFGKASGYVTGMIPDGVRRQYWRVKVTFSGTDTGTYDVDFGAA